MPQPFRRSLAVSLCALACAAGVALSLRLPTGDLRVQDKNGDGRPDTWRLYDHQGRLSEVSVDTNFDGRPDVHEFYRRGALVRRESDRNFNDRIDLVQEFDPATRQHTRSVVDVDFDGTADLLVLFRDGEPVFSKWSRPAPRPAGGPGTNVALYASAAARAARGPLTPLEDPFSRDRSVSATHSLSSSGDLVGLSASGGLPASVRDVVSSLAPSSFVSAAPTSHASSAIVVPYSPRGPPATCLAS
jgi:hypothetical protein